MDHQVDTAIAGSGHIAVSFNSSFSPKAPTTPFVSLRCKPILSALPLELLSRIAFDLSLYEYSFLSRTCSWLHRYLFNPAELVLFLKTRYRLSLKSGSIVIFAYLANMQVRAPLVLERIFQEFFADSPERLLEEEQWKRRCQQQKRLLNQNTFELNQMIVGTGCGVGESNSSLAIQRMDSSEAHRSAEKARRQAKWDAVRMLGVLYALDKTHVGVDFEFNQCFGPERSKRYRIIDISVHHYHAQLCPRAHAFSTN
ncbi:hypothetical protein BGZ54_003126 [Gamsiella multidivaricata]|nr:hypothetical protein BGZ54_003126 [Gamsiella multidivaricata]